MTNTFSVVVILSVKLVTNIFNVGATYQTDSTGTVAYAGHCVDSGERTNFFQRTELGTFKLREPTNNRLMIPTEWATQSIGFVERQLP